MRLEINIEVISGGLRLSTIAGNQYYSKQYQGYSKREAKALFKCYVAEERGRLIVEQPAFKPQVVLNSYLSSRADNILITSEGECYCHDCAKKTRNDLRSSIKILDISFRVVNSTEVEGPIYCEVCCDELIN